MQLTYNEASYIEANYVNQAHLYASESALESAGTLRIPLADVVTASVISLSLWAAIGWTLWALIS